MKKATSKLTVRRTSISPYFSPSFDELEKAALAPYAESLAAVSPELCDILITNTHTDFNLISADQINKLRLIIHPNSGFDNIPVDFIKGTKAPIIIGNTIRAQAVAQYILSALFNHFSPVPHHNTWVMERKWPRRLFSDLKIALIGYGHIGKILTPILSPMVKELAIYDPFENFTQLNYRRSDVVILAASLNDKSRHMVDKNFLNQIREDALIINAARGELIKTPDLINFLLANDEAYAVLDVMEEEPCDFGVFRNLKNIKHTSHIAGVYKEIDAHTLDFEVEVVRSFLELTEFDFKNKYQKNILQNRLRPDIGLV